MAYNPPANQLSGTFIEMPGCDRISELPDHLLTHILSYLPTKLSVKTSALSTRWKNLWLSVPVLDISRRDFHYGEDDVILSVVDRLLESNPDLRLLKVKVDCGRVKMEGLKDRISTVIQRGPQHLDVDGCIEYIEPSDNHLYPYVEFMPLPLYTSRTLVTLNLMFSGLEDTGFVCMPCLKSLTLDEVRFRDDLILEKLVSGCPVLEELTLIRDISSSFVGEVDRFMRVRSRSLKRFCVPSTWYSASCYARVKCTIEIDAPRLEHLTLREDQFDKIVVQKLASLFMVDLNIDFGDFFVPEGPSETKKFGDLFLSGISSVRYMIISETTLKALELYSRVGLIPIFNNLSRLEAVFPCILLQFLPVFLKCCPNLKHLILKIVDPEWKVDAIELKNVRTCVLSTLECVQLKRIYYLREEEIQVATYFLENAAVLKKLTLSLTDYPRRIPDEEIFEEVNKVTKLSPTCQILLEREPRVTSYYF